jgi:hypothetical protein
VDEEMCIIDTGRNKNGPICEQFDGSISFPLKILRKIPTMGEN